MNDAELRPMRLDRMRGQWVEHLAQLDAVGENVVGAYLLATIDALDDSLMQPGVAGRASTAYGAIMTLAVGMVDRFGVRASGVARCQMVDATGDALRSWSEICHQVARLSEHKLRCASI